MNGQNTLRRPGSTKDCRANDDDCLVKQSKTSGLFDPGREDITIFRNVGTYKFGLQVKRLVHREEMRGPWEGGARLTQIPCKYKAKVKNVKLSLCTPRNWMWLGRCSSIHSVTSALGEGEAPASRFGRLTIGISRTHQIGRRVNTRAGGDNRRLKKKFSYQESNYDSAGGQSVT